MIAALLIATAPVATAVDAERAFARDAQQIGQWTAFKKWADQDAVMFNPQAVWVRHLLKDAKNPPKSVRWWPAHTFLSCDGRTAVNTGPWILPNNSHGYFTTVWQRDKGVWRWTYDGGDAQTGPTPAIPKAQVHRASCRRDSRASRRTSAGALSGSGLVRCRRGRVPASKGTRHRARDVVRTASCLAWHRGASVCSRGSGPRGPNCPTSGSRGAARSSRPPHRARGNWSRSSLPKPAARR